MPILISVGTFAVLLGGWKLAEPGLIRRGWLQRGSLSGFRDEIRHYQNTRILYDRGWFSLPEVIIVGDSRIGFGIVPTVFTENSGYSCELISYPVHMGGQILQMLDFLSPLPPGRVIIGLSPASLYQKQSFTLPPISRGGGFDWPDIRAVIDNRLERKAERIRDRLVRPFSLTRTFARMAPTLANAQYRETLQKDKALRNEQLVKLGNKIAELQSRGWRVALLRMPVSPSLEKIENSDFPPEKFSRLAARLKVIYLDFSDNHSFQTSDGSHLTGRGAENFTLVLTEEMKKRGWLEPKN